MFYSWNIKPEKLRKNACHLVLGDIQLNTWPIYDLCTVVCDISLEYNKMVCINYLKTITPSPIANTQMNIMCNRNDVLDASYPCNQHYNLLNKTKFKLYGFTEND